METDVIDCKMVQHVIKSEIRNGHVMHVIYVIFFITCLTHSYFALHALHAITWYVQGSTYHIHRANSCACLQRGVTDPVLACCMTARDPEPQVRIRTVAAAGRPRPGPGPARRGGPEDSVYPETDCLIASRIYNLTGKLIH